MQKNLPLKPMKVVPSGWYTEAWVASPSCKRSHFEWKLQRAKLRFCLVNGRYYFQTKEDYVAALQLR